MKKAIFILSALICAGQLSAAPAGNTVEAGGVEKSDSTVKNVVPDVSVVYYQMEHSGKYMNVEMNVDLSELKVRSNWAVLLIPRLVNGTDSLDLPSIGIYGRDRYYIYTRNGISTLSDERELSFKAKDKPGSLSYSNLVSYLDWMNGASLKLYRSDWGCCKTKLAEYEGLLGQHNEKFFPELVPGETTIDGLAEASTYRYVSGFRPGSGRGIPMFGIKDCENLEFKEDVFTDFGKLHLLRAMAKIEVRPSEYGLPIAGAVMTRSNNSGLAVPFGVYSKTDYVKNSYIMDYLDTIHIPASPSPEVLADVPFTKQEDGSFVLYVPEYDNTSPSAVKTCIHITFDASDGIDEIYFDGDVDFKYYSAQAALDAGKNVGDKFDVKRNHYYRYTVTKKVDLSNGSSS